MLVGEDEANAALSFRNLDRVIVAWVEDITVVELLWARSLLRLAGRAGRAAGR